MIWHDQNQREGRSYQRQSLGDCITVIRVRLIWIDSRLFTPRIKRTRVNSIYRWSRCEVELYLAASDRRVHLKTIIQMFPVRIQKKPSQSKMENSYGLTKFLSKIPKKTGGWASSQHRHHPRLLSCPHSPCSSCYLSSPARYPLHKKIAFVFLRVSLPIWAFFFSWISIIHRFQKPFLESTVVGLPPF